MNFKLHLLPLGIGALLLAADPALAQGAARCAPRDAIVAQLAERFGETRQSVGLGSDNSLVELYASPETGSWSITVTRAGGPTCLVAAGRSFEHVAEALPGIDYDA